MGLSGLDVAVLLLVGLGAIFGFMRGFVVELASLAAWVIAIAAVKVLHAAVAAALTRSVGTEAGAAVLALALVFGVTFLVVKFFGRSVGKATRASILGPFDRILGLGFGALKGLVGASVAFLFLGLMLNITHGPDAPRPQWMTKSRTYPLLRATSEALVVYFSPKKAT